jgi:transposase
MPPVDRNRPVRATSSDSRYSLIEFMRQYPDDASCLERLWRNRHSEDGEHAECPKCERVRKFHKVKSRPSWSCDSCGHHLHPTAGTIFHKSSTSLHLWFYALYMITSTRCGISAKQLERELGVTYKTAWRMLNLIRNQLMDERDGEPLSGDVEIDETFYGGKPRAGHTERQRVQRRRTKPRVFGAVERGGRIRVQVFPYTRDSRQVDQVSGAIHRFVLPASMIFTDDWPGYQRHEGKFLGHRRIKHMEKVYVSGDVHTNTIEGFFGNLKNGIRGTYHSVSAKWLQGYVNEFAWRYNRRDDGRAQFESLLLRASS